MPHSGRIAFGAMESVTFGRPAAEMVAEEARRREAERVLLMASGTLNRTTDEIAMAEMGLHSILAISKRLLHRMPYSSVVRWRSVVRRQLCTSVSPS